MKKLCLAVIVLSIFGFGPLKSFFHTALNTNENSSAGEFLIHNIKNSIPAFPLQKKINSETFLLTEGGTAQNSSLLNTGLLLKYDPQNHKIMTGSVLLPQNVSQGNNDFNSLKDELKKDYHVAIDHYFQIDQAGMAHIIDLIDPQGILLDSVNNVKEGANPSQWLHGNEIVTMMNNGNPEEIKSIFSALENNIKSTESTEKLISLAPSLIQEMIKSVKTDLGTGELAVLGLSAIMDPATGVEAVKMPEGNQNQKQLTFN